MECVNLSVIWVLLLIISTAYAIFNGRITELGTALFDGAASSVTFILSIAGMLMLWSAVLEVMRRSGLSGRLSRLLTPVIRRLYPEYRADSDVCSAVCENMTANLLGLGNAATPAGVRAVNGMVRLTGHDASAGLCRFVVMNTASIQLIPATVAAMRAGAGANAPFDILPAVWITSAVSVSVGLAAAYLFERLSK